MQPRRFVMNDYKRSTLLNKDRLKVCVFVCSSTGDGEAPENGQAFFRWLRRETDSTALKHMFYTILGLGSSDYSHFQGAPRFLDERLACLGGKRFYNRAEADEATSLEIIIEPWMEGLPSSLR